MAETYRWGFETSRDLERAATYYVGACQMGLEPACRMLKAWHEGEGFPEQFRMRRDR